MSEQVNNRRFPSYVVAKLCSYCLSPSWIEFDHEQKLYVDMNTQKKHVCPSIHYKIANTGHDNDFTEEQAIVRRLNRNWRGYL